MQVLVLVVVEDVGGEGDEAGRPVPGDRLVGTDQHSQLLSSKTRLQGGRESIILNLSKGLSGSKSSCLGL